MFVFSLPVDYCYRSEWGPNPGPSETCPRLPGHHHGGYSPSCLVYFCWPHWNNEMRSNRPPRLTSSYGWFHCHPFDLSSGPGPHLWTWAVWEFETVFCCKQDLAVLSPTLFEWKVAGRFALLLLACSTWSRWAFSWIRK